MILNHEDSYLYMAGVGKTSGGNKYAYIQSVDTSSLTHLAQEEYQLSLGTNQEFIDISFLDYQRYSTNSVVLGGCVSLFYDVPAAWFTFNYASDSGPYGFYSSDTDKIQITTKSLVNVQCMGAKIYGSNQSMLLYFLGR